LLVVFSANERPIANINSSSLANSIRQRSTLDPIVVKNTKEALKLPLSFYFCACFLNFQKLPKFHLDGVHNHRIRVLDGY
jgi:MFS-type transporter involved in bile tolerance (Atg22 family)